MFSSGRMSEFCFFRVMFSRITHTCSHSYLPLSVSVSVLDVWAYVLVFRIHILVLVHFDACCSSLSSSTTRAWLSRPTAGTSTAPPSTSWRTRAERTLFECFSHECLLSRSRRVASLAHSLSFVSIRRPHFSIVWIHSTHSIDHIPPNKSTFI